jgi:hypothetical protein
MEEVLARIEAEKGGEAAAGPGKAVDEGSAHGTRGGAAGRERRRR